MNLTSVALIIVAAAVVGACSTSSGEGDAGTTVGETSTAGTGTTSVDPSTPTTATSTTAMADSSSGPTCTSMSTGMTGDEDDDATATSGGPEPGIECDFSESFDLPDGSPWPAHWTITGGTMIADVVGGRGRLVPTPGPYAVARVYTPFDCTDVDVVFSFQLSSPSSQGFGMYVRQNGGYLEETDPAGEGYSTFLQAFNEPSGISVWREVGGVEQIIEGVTPGPIEANVLYRARLRVTQQDDDTTRLRARYWPASGSEPQMWQVDRTDTTPSLQWAGGGLAVDTYLVPNAQPPVDMFVDDILVTAAPVE